MKKGLFTALGFTLFILGSSALVLSLVGIRLSFLTWIDGAGRLTGFIVRLLMIVGGIVIAVLANTDWRNEDSE